MELFQGILSLVVHLDVHLADAIKTYGQSVHLILFLIIFCETGLVLTPFLPGDSLLFLIGTFVARGDFEFISISCLLIVAAILGDLVNYLIGTYFGKKVFDTRRTERRFFKRKYLEKTQLFFERYGAKTIVIARFIPIVRTYAPFVAGAASYPYKQFLFFNVLGALIWILSLITTGFLLGEVELVRNNLTAVIFVIIFLSISPALVEVIRARLKN